MATIIDGKRIAEEVLAEAAKEVARLVDKHGVTPGLAAVLVGEDAASEVYVRNKTRSCEQAGLFAQTVRMPAQTTQGKVLEMVQRLNRDPRVHGILVQLPLPRHISEAAVIAAIVPEKDVDGQTAVSLGRLAAGDPVFVPATPTGIVELLRRSGIDPEGKHVVICGRSTLVAKPLALLLVRKAAGANATVTICHTRTRDLASHTRQADILVAAIGQPQAITADMVKDGAVVIDVGINRISDATTKSGTRLVGDVDFAGVREKASAITPVPGGVGPMTVAMVVSNTVLAARRMAEGVAKDSKPRATLDIVPPVA